MRAPSAPPAAGGAPGALAVAGGLVALVLVTPPLPAGAQGLGDTAARERQRRESPEKEVPAKVFTNDDLSSAEDARGEEDGEADAGESGDDAPATAVPGLESDAEFRERADKERAERALRERDWRARFAEARARVREEEAKGWREVVRTQFNQGIPVQMKVKEFVETEEFRQAKKDLADLQEEFRRTGLPPGWARE